MTNSLRHPFVLLLMILIIGLGPAQARSAACPPGCPDCQDVPACCAETDGASSGSGGTIDHLPGPGGCGHDGICLDEMLPISLSTVGLTYPHDTASGLSLPESQVCPAPVCFTTAPVILKPPPDKFSPPLYLRNCSFLI